MAQSSIKKNAVMNMLLTAANFVFPLITFPYVSRALLPEGTGRVQFAASFVAYFGMLARLGIPTYGLRECARIRDDRQKLTKTAQELLLINLIMGLIAYAGLFVCLFTVPRLKNDKLLFVVSALPILLDALGMEWLYKALEQYPYITVRSFCFKLVALAGTFMFIHAREDYLIYGVITIFASSASNILNFVHARKFISLKPTGSYRLSAHMKGILVFFAMSCAMTVYYNFDAVMLGFIKGDSEVGYYNAAVKIKNILINIVTSVSAVLLPRSSYYIEHGQRDEFSRITKKALHLVMLASLPMAAYFMLFAREGILFLSGPAYGGVVLPMQIIMPTLIIAGMSNITGTQMMVPLGKDRQLLFSVCAGAATDLALNALLIPRFASAGAAAGTLAAEIVVLAVQYFTLKGELSGALKQFAYGKVALALTAALACSAWVKLLHAGHFVTLVISGVCFFGAYIALLLITKESVVTEAFRAVQARIRRFRRKGT